MGIKVIRPNLSAEEREHRMEILKEATIQFFKEVERNGKRLSDRRASGDGDC